MDNAPTEIFRIDPLTGCRNFLGFIETLEALPSLREKQPFSILYADLNYLASLNTTRGYNYGDSALRWIELVLREESGTQTYRLGGDDFGVILTGSRAENDAILTKMLLRMTREAPQVDLPNPAASVALIHYPSQDTYTVEELFIHLVLAMMQIKIKLDRNFHVFESADLTLARIGSDPQVTSETLQQVTHLAFKRTLFMGRLLDTVQKSAYIDSTSGLPNMRAAMQAMNATLKEAAVSGKPFSLLLMDGDNLRLYNEISYVAGDEMIRQISDLLTRNLRPGDFVARWRTGDEFVAVLPGTPAAGARVVAERFRLAVKEASQAWTFPTSISIGVACYPWHGRSIDELVNKAELALKRAKEAGKDTVVLADPS